MAVEAGYGDWNAPPTLTTVEMSVPVDCAPPNRTVVPGTNSTRLSGGVQLLVNMQTSVVGFVALEVQQGGAPAAGFDLARADQLKGSAVSAVASWGGGATASLSALAGQRVALRIAIADAKLFSVRMECAPRTEK